VFSANNSRIALIASTIVGVTLLHYLTLTEMRYEHTFLRLLYYVPLVLASLWYGLRGSLAVCGTATALYSPYMLIQWHGLSTEDFDKLMEGILFVGIAILLGILIEREKRHVRALMEAESLAAVGRAVAEIAPDMKSPLMSIGGFVHQVARQIPSDDPNRKKLDIAIRETARLEDMLKGMLEFSRPVKLMTSEVDVNKLITDLLDVLGSKAKERGIAMIPELSTDLPKVEADPDKIHRVLQNIIANAVQASPEGETIKIATAANGNTITIEVKDHGAGIIQQHKESVFHPFFTTKKSGTGLGLGVAKKITEAHGGKIYFNSNQNEPGVTFVVELPGSSPA